jgi:hypothetical protein
MSSRRFAFTAICTSQGYLIASVEEGVAGWTPVADEAPCVDVDAADRRAQLLNDNLKLGSADVWAIVASSMEASLREPRGSWSLRCG